MTLRNQLLVLFALVVGTFAAPAAEARPLTPREIYKKAAPGVVLVFGTDGSSQGSAGTGSIISKNGEVITNAHVVSKDGTPYKKLFVYLKPEKLQGSMQADLRQRYRAVLVDIDPELDLALLRMMEPPPNLTVIDFVSPEDVDVGEPVVAIGHPETGGLWTLTSGTVSAVVSDFQGKTGKDVFQTDASVNRGNSGGPLLNAYAQMVGINTCISRKAADGLAITAINFSLKSSVVIDWLARQGTMNIAYVKPGDPKDDQALALADGTATTPPRPTVGAAKPPQDQPISVVTPKRGQDVADDPEFTRAAEATFLVNRDADGPSKPPAPVQPKHLTKARPYDLDPFVAKRVAEIKALEGMMDEMSKRIDEQRGRPTKKAKGLGLW